MRIRPEKTPVLLSIKAGVPLISRSPDPIHAALVVLVQIPGHHAFGVPCPPNLHKPLALFLPPKPGVSDLEVGVAQVGACEMGLQLREYVLDPALTSTVAGPRPPTRSRWQSNGRSAWRGPCPSACRRRPLKREAGFIAYHRVKDFSDLAQRGECLFQNRNNVCIVVHVAVVNGISVTVGVGGVLVIVLLGKRCVLAEPRRWRGREALESCAGCKAARASSSFIFHCDQENKNVTFSPPWDVVADAYDLGAIIICRRNRDQEVC